MNPYLYVHEAVSRGESLLSLCCGIGLELQGLTNDITAVDIAPQYIEKLKEDNPRINAVCSGALEYIEAQPDNSVDVISIIDGIEHLDKKTGLKVINHMKRVARKYVLLFTPEGYLKNEPHNAWGIEGADEYQTHKSGWKREELINLGFKLLEEHPGISQHGDQFTETMFIYVKE